MAVSILILMVDRRLWDSKVPVVNGRTHSIVTSSVTFCVPDGNVRVVVLLAVEVDVEAVMKAMRIDLRNVDRELLPRNGMDSPNHSRIG